MAIPPGQDAARVKAPALGFRLRRMLEGGSHRTVKELVADEKITASYICRVLRLTLLAPDLVKAIMRGRQPYNGRGSL